MFTLVIEDKHGTVADEYSFEHGEFFVGRSHKADIILPSDNVSRRHARLYTADGRCFIEDLNSANGVFVDGRRIQEVTQLTRIAQVRIGDFYLHVDSDVEASDFEEGTTWATLIGRSTGFAGRAFPMTTKTVLVGRGKDCALTFVDPSVSRIHAKLSIERAGVLTLEDLRSSNGTFVNGERIGVAPVQHRDCIKFGNLEFILELPDRSSELDAVQTKPKKVAEAREVPAGRLPGPSAAAEGRREPGAAPDAPMPAGAPAPLAARMGFNEAEWDRADKRRWVMPVVVGLVLTLLLVGGLILFRDAIFGDGGGAAAPTEPRTTEGAATAAQPGAATAKPGASEVSKAVEPKQAIAAALDAGREAIKARDWARASERFQAALDLDPLHEEARQALNRVKVWSQQHDQLEEARKLRDGLKRGEAAKLLRRIDDTSVYYSDAQNELQKLLEGKAVLKLNAESDLRQGDCQGAISALQEVLLIDPKDAEAPAKLAAAEALIGTSKCKP